jgi:hypothetical protein
MGRTAGRRELQAALSDIAAADCKWLLSFGSRLLRQHGHLLSKHEKTCAPLRRLLLKQARQAHTNPPR